MNRIVLILILFSFGCHSSQTGNESAENEPSSTETNSPSDAKDDVAYEVVPDKERIKSFGLYEGEVLSAVEKFLKENPDAPVEDLCNLELSSGDGPSIRLKHVAKISVVQGEK